jgi:hypothetical protein
MPTVSCSASIESSPRLPGPKSSVSLGFPRADPEHAIIDQKLSDIVEGDLGHQFKKACHPELVEGTSHYFRVSNSNKPN